MDRWGPTRGARDHRLCRVSSAIEADEDSEVLVDSDREPLTEDDWLRARGWLERSRSELLQLLDGLSGEELDRRRDASERTLREEIQHVAFVELVYAAWTFDLSTRDGLRGFLVEARSCCVAARRPLRSQGRRPHVGRVGGRASARAVDAAQGRAQARLARAAAPCDMQGFDRGRAPRT